MPCEICWKSGACVWRDKVPHSPLANGVLELLPMILTNLHCVPSICKSPAYAVRDPLLLHPCGAGSVHRRVTPYKTQQGMPGFQQGFLHLDRDCTGAGLRFTLQITIDLVISLYENVRARRQDWR